MLGSLVIGLFVRRYIASMADYMTAGRALTRIPENPLAVHDKRLFVW